MDTQNGRIKREFGERDFGVKIDTMIDIIKTVFNWAFNRLYEMK